VRSRQREERENYWYLQTQAGNRCLVDANFEHPAPAHSSTASAPKISNLHAADVPWAGQQQVLQLQVSVHYTTASHAQPQSAVLLRGASKIAILEMGRRWEAKVVQAQQ
jgi:hypothetical protein